MIYEQLLTSELEILADAEQLLALASAGRSDEFNRLREAYLKRIAHLQSLRTQVQIDDEQRDVLLEIALALVRLDGQIRRLVDPRSSRADVWLGASAKAAKTPHRKPKVVGV